MARKNQFYISKLYFSLCFLGPRKLNCWFCYTREKRYTMHARSLLKIALTIIIYSSTEHKYLWSISNKECHLLNAFYRSIFICNFHLCHIYSFHNSYTCIFSEWYCFNYLSKVEKQCLPPNHWNSKGLEYLLFYNDKSKYPN